MIWALGQITQRQVVNKSVLAGVVEYQKRVNLITGRRQVGLALAGMVETTTMEEDSIGIKLIAHAASVAGQVAMKQHKLTMRSKAY